MPNSVVALAVSAVYDRGFCPGAMGCGRAALTAAVDRHWCHVVWWLCRISPPHPQIAQPPSEDFVMSAVEEKLKKMGYTLPPTFKFPNPNRTGCVIVGLDRIRFGARPRPADRCRTSNTPERSARTSPSRKDTRPPSAVALFHPRRYLKQQLGDLDRGETRGAAVRHGQRGARLRSHAQVIDGASDFFYELFGPEFGQHARSDRRSRRTSARHPGGDQRRIRIARTRAIHRAMRHEAALIAIERG